jgi:hypothetical protein
VDAETEISADGDTSSRRLSALFDFETKRNGFGGYGESALAPSNPLSQATSLLRRANLARPILVIPVIASHVASRPVLA